MDTESKTCPRCKQTFPRTAEFFYHDSSKKDGLVLYCKACIAARSHDYYEAHKEEAAAYGLAHKEEIAVTHRAYYLAHKEEIAASARAYYLTHKEELIARAHARVAARIGSVRSSMPTKTCPKCKQTLPATVKFFYRDISTQDGLKVYCKACADARSRAYHLAHKEEIAARAHARIAAHEEEMAVIHLAWRAAHPKQAVQAAVPKPSYGLVRKGEMAAIHLAWRAAHPKQAADVVIKPGYAEYDRYGRLVEVTTTGMAGPGNEKGGGG